MKIRVLTNFGGVLTNEKRIVEGVYDSEDPKLFGIADYLVKHLHAVVVVEDNSELEDVQPIIIAYHNIISFPVVQPPSTRRSSPVIKSEAVEAK